MDPVTAFAIVALMMLLNGGVLGLMHSDLPPALRPSAVTWRISTLLLACGCILFAVQAYLPPWFVLPLSNGITQLGITGYWHAMRQFYGRPDSIWLLAPAVMATAGIAWFAGPQPDLLARIVIASLAAAVTLIGAAWTVLSATRADGVLSARVLAAMFALLAVFMLLRCLYFIALAQVPSTVTDPRSWMNVITPMLVSILPVIGTTGFLLLCSDRIRRQWEIAASTDALTGLANRRTLAGVGARRLAQAREEGGLVALAVADIDHFKSINDRFGHDAGDLALQYVAARLSEVCGRRHLLARQGGEEFVAVLDVVSASEAKSIAERLREAVCFQPFQHGDVALTITISIGVAVLTGRDAQLDDLLRRADVALYAAKRGGRDRVVSEGD
ncbi:MAG: GGDEF domain-containing protein [Rhodanobacteraceae bacterium]|nr:GGDEF domain-containing protein [Rhodanobacteraceae bacterium]